MTLLTFQRSTFLVLALLTGVFATLGAPFQNGSFELPIESQSRGLPVGDVSVTGWQASGTGPIAIYKGSVPGDRIPYEFGGQQYLAFNGGDQASGGSVSQTFDTVPGQAYRVGFVLGRTGQGKGELLMDCSVLTEDGRVLRQSTGVPPPDLGWGLTNQTTFIAVSSRSIIRFRDISPATASTDLLLDAVSVAALPGPTVDLYAGIKVTGVSGKHYRIDYIEPEAPETWKPLATVTLLSDTQVVFDPDAANRQFRFYRVVLVD